MSCTRRSEKRFTCTLRNAATAEFPVVNLGVWQSAHPTAVNTVLPFAIEDAPPGVSADGVGGARNRMNIANLSISLRTASGVVPSVSVTLLGAVANWQLEVSSRSV